MEIEQFTAPATKASNSERTLNDKKNTHSIARSSVAFRAENTCFVENTNNIAMNVFEHRKHDPEEKTKKSSTQKKK